MLVNYLGIFIIYIFIFTDESRVSSKTGLSDRSNYFLSRLLEKNLRYFYMSAINTGNHAYLYIYVAGWYNTGVQPAYKQSHQFLRQGWLWSVATPGAYPGADPQPEPEQHLMKTAKDREYTNQSINN